VALTWHIALDASTFDTIDLEGYSLDTPRRRRSTQATESAK
jgi:hypothetical protein